MISSTRGYPPKRNYNLLLRLQCAVTGIFTATQQYVGLENLFLFEFCKILPLRRLNYPFKSSFAAKLCLILKFNATSCIFVHTLFYTIYDGAANSAANYFQVGFCHPECTHCFLTFYAQFATVSLF